MQSRPASSPPPDQTRGDRTLPLHPQKLSPLGPHVKWGSQKNRIRTFKKKKHDLHDRASALAGSATKPYPEAEGDPTSCSHSLA